MSQTVEPAVENTPVPQQGTVWLINLFFGAGAAPTGRLLESLAVGLQQVGWQVSVICGRAEYRQGAVADYSRFQGQITRLWCRSLRPGTRGKLLTWGTFYLRLAWFLCWSRLPDVVLVQTTPPFLHTLIALRNLLSRRRTRIVLWNQDTYPDYLVAAGWTKPNRWWYRILNWWAGWSARRIAVAVVLDEAMRQRLQEQHATQYCVIPNWEVPSAPIFAAPVSLPGSPLSALPECMRQAVEGYRWKIAYTGNLGVGHSLLPLWEFLRAHPHQRDLCVLIVGEGERTAEARKLVEQEGWSAVTFWPYLPGSQYQQFLQWIDWGLIALTPDCAGVMSPSKLHSFLAAGKPVVFLGPQSTNVAETIAIYGCGVVLDPLDLHSLTNWIEELRQAPPAGDELSQNALRAWRERHSEAVAWHAWTNLLAELQQRPRK